MRGDELDRIDLCRARASHTSIMRWGRNSPDCSSVSAPHRTCINPVATEAAHGLRSAAFCLLLLKLVSCDGYEWGGMASKPLESKNQTWKCLHTNCGLLLLVLFHICLSLSTPPSAHTHICAREKAEWLYELSMSVSVDSGR
jgi:hypothetical protein